MVVVWERDIYEAGNDGSIFRLSVIVAGWPVFIDPVYRAKWPRYLRFIIHCGSFDIAKLARPSTDIYMYMYMYIIHVIFALILYFPFFFFVRFHLIFFFLFFINCSRVTEQRTSTINRLESMCAIIIK